MLRAQTLIDKNIKEIQFISGPASNEARAVSTPEACGSDSLVFVSSSDHLQKIAEASPSLVILDQKTYSKQSSVAFQTLNSSICFFVTPNIQTAMSLVLPFFDRSTSCWDYHQDIDTSQTFIHPTAKIGPNVVIQPFTSIGANVIIGANVKIGNGVTIQDRAIVGQNTILHPHVFIGSDTEIGIDCEIHPNTTIGAHGFGFATNSQFKHTKIPQIGRVIIGDRVRIGANCAIDRATINTTKIGSGSKIDNLCHIAHNCEIGEDAVIAAGFMIAGSSKIGSQFMVGGGAVVSDHVTITDQVVLAGRSTVTNDIQEKGAYGGYPLQPLKDSLKTLASLPHLVDLRKQLSKISKTLSLDSQE